MGWPLLIPISLLNITYGESWLPDVAGVAIVWAVVGILIAFGGG